MASAARRAVAALAALATAAGLAGCGQVTGKAPAPAAAAAQQLPERILRAPRSLLSAAQPQADGAMWALAGRTSAGLFELSPAGGQPSDSVSVSSAARSVAESASGVVGLALGARRSGALELLAGRTGRAIRTVPLPAPALQVAANGSTFYVLTAWSATASVTVVNGRSGAVRGSIPVPADTVAIAPDPAQADLYVLESTGLVDEIAISGGRIVSKFTVGSPGLSMAMSPDGGTLYVLKGTTEVSNIAVVDVSTEAVTRVLPAPSHCRALVISASGRQLYEVVGTAGYGNIQVFAI